MAGDEAVEDIFLCLGQCVRVGCDLHEGIAANGEAFADGGEEREGCGFGGKGAVFDDDSADGGSGCEGFEAFAGYGVEDNAGTFACGDLVDAGDEVFFVGDDDVVSAEGEELGFFGGGAGSGDADDAFSFDELDGGEAYATAGCGEEDEVALGNVSMVDEGTVGGDVLHPDGCAFFGGEACRVLGDRVDWDDCDFTTDAVFVESEGWNGAGGFSEPERIDTWADGFDGTGCLVAQLGREFGGDEILVFAEHDLGAVESDGFDAEANLTCCGLRERKLIELKDVGGADFVEAYDLCGL